MIFRFIFVGKTKESWVQTGEQDYLQRLGQFGKTEVVVVSEQIKGEPDKVRELEGRAILAKIKSTEFVCLLTIQGKQLTSRKLAEELSKWEVQGGGQLTFVIGGSWGVSQEVVDRANFQLSLSKMTFPHEMIRPFLLEQIYRALTINQGKTYHKGS